MRLVITYTSDRILKLPRDYNEILQGFIYRNLDASVGNFIHNEGFRYEKRQFKLFTFSRILGKTKINEKFFLISSPFKLVVSSPYNEILMSMANSLFTKPESNLAGNAVTISSIEVKVAPEIESGAHIYFLSPITVYSTVVKADGKKKTYYYNPKEAEFSELVRENLIKKYVAFFGRKPADINFSIEPIKVSNRDEKIVIYKGFVIKGWMGHYRISGSQELLKFAYDAGVGAKNSQGFGCFEVVRAGLW